MKRTMSTLRLGAVTALAMAVSISMATRVGGQEATTTAGMQRASQAGQTPTPPDPPTSQAPPTPSATSRTAPTGKALDALTDQVASQLRCPVCRSLSVKDSQAELSQKVKELIREKLAEGESPEQVKAYFVSKYGEWILLSPPKHGVTLLVWVLPLVAIAGGAAVLVLFLRRWVGPGGGDADGDNLPASMAPSLAVSDPRQERDV